MSDTAPATAPAPADISLGNVPVIMDFVNNLVIAVGSLLAGVLHVSGAPVIAEIGAVATAVIGFGASAIHVSMTSWLGKLFGALNASGTSPAAAS